MHQTFYIDVDEEITSIIERIRKAVAEDIVMVVPKGAMLIQSIINLKLLKKEADEMEKELVIVTQDKIGKLLVEKAGILAQQKLEDVEGEELEHIPEVKVVKEDELSLETEKKSQKNLDKIGSTSFFESEEMDKEEKIEIDSTYPLNDLSGKDINEENGEAEKILNKELVIDLGKDIKKGKSTFKKGSGSMDLVKNVSIKSKQKMDVVEQKSKNFLPADNFKDERVEQFFSHTENFKNYKQGLSEKKERLEKKEEVRLPFRFWKSILIFGLLVGIFAFGFSAYLFLPKAKVTVFLKTKSQSLDAEVSGDIKNTAINLNNRSIPAKSISFIDEISKSFPTSGEKSASSRKSHGTITIYNEYSSTSQQLVATTRFLSADGKLFRLVSAATIPGLTNVSGEIKPGAVEAEVVADEAGESFNIGATSFSIPGFQSSGGDKYSKFYAKSFKAMTGGGNGESVVKAVSAGDVESAKNKLMTEFNAGLKQKVADQAGQDYIILEDALSVSETNYGLSNSVGDLADEFTVTLKAKVSALVFTEKDLKEVIKNMMEKSIGGDFGITDKTLTLDFGKADADFNNGTILIRAHGNGKTDSEIDLENLKKGILGKTNADLEAYLKDFSEFSNVEVEYWPAFMSAKVPIYESRVEVVLDNN